MTAAIAAIAVEGGAEGVAAWGEGAAAAGEVASVTEGGFPGEIDLGGGFKLKLVPDMFRQIMHTAGMTAAVQARCEELTNLCNELAITAGAVYTYTVSTNPNNIRARGRVRPGNFKAVVDDAAHSTLLKALASVGSDPIPVSVEGGGVEGPAGMPGIPQVAEEAGGAEAGAAAGGEAAAGLSAEEVAVIALA
jgi:hypothetical protein